MTQVRHTAGLAAGELAEIRDLLDAAFDGDVGDTDLAHACLNPPPALLRRAFRPPAGACTSSSGRTGGSSRTARLGAAEDGAALYTARGRRCWPGTVSVVGPRGIERCPAEDGAAYVLPVTAALVEAGALTSSP